MKTSCCAPNSSSNNCSLTATGCHTLTKTVCRAPNCSSNNCSLTATTRHVSMNTACFAPESCSQRLFTVSGSRQRSGRPCLLARRQGGRSGPLLWLRKSLRALSGRGPDFGRSGRRRAPIQQPGTKCSHAHSRPLLPRGTFRAWKPEHTL